MQGKMSDPGRENSLGKNVELRINTVLLLSICGMKISARKKRVEKRHTYLNLDGLRC